MTTSGTSNLKNKQRAKQKPQSGGKPRLTMPRMAGPAPDEERYALAARATNDVADEKQLEHAANVLAALGRASLFSRVAVAGPGVILRLASRAADGL